MRSIPVYNAAAYVRASKDDPDSAAIENQTEFIREYVKDKSDIRIISVKKDNGFSGVDFIRPSFNEMMTDIEAGKINCVIVKDAYVKNRLKNFEEVEKFI